MVDPVSGFVYAESGSDGAGSAALWQAGTASFAAPAPVEATLGAGAVINLHSPAFNDKYFSSVTATDWLLYEGGLNAGGTANTLYGITFSAGHAMTAGTPPLATNQIPFGFGPVDFSPFTEFLTTAGEDRLFESGISAFAGNLASFNISTTFPGGLEHFATEGSGTTGIVIDNGSASAQADSLYFGVLTSNTAVKVTQGALN
jgi:hypothetical protein